MKTYCCGENARKERFARKWERVNDPTKLNPAILPPSERAREDAKTIIDEIGCLPRLVLPGNGGLILEWDVVCGCVSLSLDAEDHEYDILKCKGQSYYPITTEKVQDLINKEGII
jgi:hypothetical protein